MFAAPLVLLLATAITAPQSPDTLVYREISDGRIEVAGPQGRVAMETTHDARIVLVQVTDDSAHAWYDELELGVTGPQGEFRPATEAALDQEFVLRFDANGRVETLATPVFPESFTGVTDLTKQFYDFFMPEPDTEIAPGVSWADTLAYTDTTSSGNATHATKRGDYAVVGDSVVRGSDVWVVAARVEHEIRSEGPGPQAGVTAISILKGLDTGEFYIDKAHGHMVGRKRTGDLKGEIRYEGLPEPVSLPQTMSYTNSVELLRALVKPER